MFASANAVLAISGACLANSLYMRENALVPGGEFWRSFFKVPPPKRMMARHGFNLVYIYIYIYASPVATRSCLFSTFLAEAKPNFKST